MNKMSTILFGIFFPHKVGKYVYIGVSYTQGKPFYFKTFPPVFHERVKKKRGMCQWSQHV